MNDFLSIVTAVNRPVNCDLEKGLLFDAVFVTTGLATDGWIILPSGLVLTRYAANAQISARHLTGAAPEAQSQTRPLVIANALNLRPGETALLADVQFARTQDGYDWGYLYGLNPEKKAFMRAWSVEGSILERAAVNWPKARALSGQYWDENLAALLQKKLTSVNVAMRFEPILVAAVTIGADRNALTRAADCGCRTAGQLVAGIDLRTASEELAGLKAKLSETDARIGKLEGEIQALRSDGASAAARGDSEALLSEVRSLRLLIGRE
jgi:hypothetical protein